MRLEHSFSLPMQYDDAWRFLTDLERVAPCMPGALLEGVEDDAYLGKVVTRLGPITAEYRGTVRIVEQSAQDGRIVMEAQGRDTRGQGKASAVISASLVAGSGGTDVAVVTDLTLSGRVVQFGRGVIADVSETLIAEFVRRVAEEGGSVEAPLVQAEAAPERNDLNVFQVVLLGSLRRLWRRLRPSRRAGSRRQQEG